MAVLIQFQGLFCSCPRRLFPYQPRDAITVTCEILDLFTLGESSHHAVEGFVCVLFGNDAASGFEKFEEFSTSVLVKTSRLVAIRIQGIEKRIEGFWCEGP